MPTLNELHQRQSAMLQAPVLSLNYIYLLCCCGLPAEVVEVACGIAPMLSGEIVENVASGIDCYSIRQPLGVRQQGGGVSGPPDCSPKTLRVNSPSDPSAPSATLVVFH